MLNLAFELQKDKDLRDGELFRPFKLVSLWNVLRFYAKSFVDICIFLGKFSGQVKTLERVGIQIDISDLPSLEDVEEFSKLEQTLKDMELICSSKGAARLLNYGRNISKKREFTELAHLGDELTRVIKDELEDKLFFVIRSRRARFYDEEGTILGKEAVSRFNDITRDAIEAGKCFAVARYTACVFHLMRIAEFMNQQFAKELGITSIQTRKGPVKTEDADWRMIHDHIAKEINDNKPNRNKDLREKCSNLLTRIGPFREVRNPLAHPPGDFYTEEEAETFIKCIQSFTKKFCDVFPKT